MGGAFQVVWQGANNHLWTTGSNGPIDTGGAMAPGTSPSVTTEGSAPYRGYFAAFHGSNGDMWWNDVEVGAFGPRLLDSGMAMAAGTSPSAGDVVAGNLPTTAFQGSNGHLQLFGETHGNNGEFDTGLAMMAGSSPSLRTNMLYDRPGNPLGGNTYYVGYASNTGVLSVYGLNEFGTTVSTDLVQSTGQVAAAGSSPSLVSALNAVYGGSVVGPAAATSSAAAGTAAAPPKPPSTPTIKPDTAPLVTSDTCPTVRAHLKQYAARGIKQVSCQTTTSAAPPTPARPGASANTSPRTNAVTPQIAGSAVCSSTQWTIIRTEQCFQNYVQTKDAIDTSTGDVLGSLTWVSSKDIVLAVNSTQITERNSISLVDWQGINVGRPVTLTESATCSSLCQVTSPPATRFTLSLNQTETYNFTYQDNPGTQAPDTFNITWSEDQSIPGLVSNPTLVQSAPASIRCDNQFPGNMGAGCVIPSYAPTLVLPLSVYGGAAMNVWVAENYLPGTPGLSTSTPLTRGDPARTTPNRTAICNSFKPFPDPNPFVAVDSCDEYPFASTQQSGAALGATGSNCLEILPTHNPDTGAWEWFDLTRYTFTASQVCVRGHVNQTLNSNVGTMALNPMYTANRMLIGDPFTVQVTQ
ncbi:MAG TPA: hypothetical protein VFN75_05590 [Pseudonocardiaceae bacterium]|nr:hypothetical protein [Pseudonocardiaceae bacterium]